MTGVPPAPSPNGSVPPTSRRAEEAVLGLLLWEPSSVPKLLPELRADLFYRTDHRQLLALIEQLHYSGQTVSAATVAVEADKRDVTRHLADVTIALHEPAAASTTEALHLIGELDDLARRRKVIGAAERLRQQAHDLSDPDYLDGALDSFTHDGLAGHRRDRMVGLGAFLFDVPERPPAVWGEGDRIAWAQGESVWLIGPPGVGKTTLAAQLMLGRLGLLPDPLLGMPVQAGEGRVLYLAGDRPAQAQRALARLTRTYDLDRDYLDKMGRVHKGPPPFLLNQHPERLAAWARQHEADTIVLDSLKDVAVDLASDESGSRTNIALQTCLADGIEVIALHHPRKPGGDKGRRPTSIEDVYGSMMLTAGAGSVLSLWGKAGDPVVQLHHLKQPADDLGHLQILHDHDAGTSTLARHVTLLDLLNSATNGLTARDAATRLYATTEPDEATLQKARRQLKKLVDAGQAHKSDGQPGGAGGGTPDRYFPTTLLNLPTT